VRVVLDPNIVISGVLSSQGAPANVLRALAAGEFELIVSSALLDELERALGYPKLRRQIDDAAPAALVRWLADSATHAADPATEPPMHSRDPDDDYLVALAAAHRAALVSGDKHLLALDDEIPVFSPRAFVDLLAKNP
jgi:putative PIN family toxin of toxin-antitoxin system